VAAPMVGGLGTSFLMELLVYPAIYLLWKWRSEVRHLAGVPQTPQEHLALAESYRRVP
jgi:Cu(I)/Ag(I) efflux system membrane protein CusA/SilA